MGSVPTHLSSLDRSHGNTSFHFSHPIDERLAHDQLHLWQKGQQVEPRDEEPAKTKHQRRQRLRDSRRLVLSISPFPKRVKGIT